MAISSEERERIREEELIRLEARDEFNSRGLHRRRWGAPAAILGVSVTGVLLLLFAILNTKGLQ